MPMTRLLTRGVLLATLCFAACDIPTGLPKWDTTWVVQSEGTTLSVGQLLPSSVQLNNNAFTLTLSPSNFNTTLGARCGSCAALNGLTGPKPAFTGSFNTSIALPSDVVGAALTSGSVNLVLTNNFNFDPIAPAGAVTAGSITITIKSGTTTLGTAVISGSNTTFAPGTTRPVGISLSGAISGPIDVTVTVDSPAGSAPATPYNTSATLAATATPTGLSVSSATVRVQSRNVTATQTTIDLSGVDTSISDHVASGSLLLAINNPFNVTGNLTLTISGTSGGNIQKQIALASGQSNLEVAFTGAELRSMLGRKVTLSINGPVSAASNVTVTPSQTLSVTSKIRLVISIGSN